jgi:hypothetical protein
MKQFFFLTLPITSILTLMFLDWLVSTLWRRFRSHDDRSDHADATRPPAEDRSNAQAR